ncbi:uncharacterized protein EI90DRAFT_3008558 [Cantharellus anzutake]|uniref:uncharacterized protein n=1 Tax=Cantharellus anzutake TaxID=1750568 RepID=UPI0019080AF6|nr:uncharacterized protein EI90DRAFT_3008558 [Cantharellus anzutake]KAF8308918.1 hypothetical protein EI90DRAFT_3008558 [Cantharellus anzutake]
MDPASSAVMEALSTIRGVQDLSHQFGTKVLIARGGYSEVYRAEWLQSGTLAPVNVCYKVLKPPISDMPPVVEEVKKTMKVRAFSAGLTTLKSTYFTST